MIEKTILDYLTARLDCPVYAELPSPLPERFVLIEKTGSGREDYISSAMFALQSYGTSLYDSAGLNERVKAAMDALILLDDICAVRLNSDYPFDDTLNHRHRYQAVYDITHY